MSYLLRKTLTTAAIVVALGTASVASAVDQLKTEKDKISYMVGMDMGKGLTSIKDEIDIAVVVQALQASMKGEKTLLTQEEALKVRQDFMQQLQAKQTAKDKESAEKNKKEGEEFLAKNKTKAGVKTTASGLQYEVMSEGKGPKPKATDTVKVNYKGTKIDGTTFDSSYDRGQPATFPLNGVIPGWTEALQLMTVGSKYKVYVPSNLAYADHAPPSIGPNATLIFEVELLAIENPPAAKDAPEAPKAADAPKKEGDKP